MAALRDWPPRLRLAEIRRLLFKISPKLVGDALVSRSRIIMFSIQVLDKYARKRAGAVLT